MKSIFVAVLFLVAVPATAQMIKEYIRLGDRLVAVESNAGQVAPTADGDSPSSGSNSGTIVFTYSDFNGATDLGVTNILINSALDGSNACYLAYVRTLNILYLYSDNFQTAEALSIGSSGSVGVNNTRCQVNGSGTSATLSGTTLTLTVNFTFKAAFTGRQVIYTAAGDGAGANSGWQSMGVRYLPMPTSLPNVPEVVSLSPARTTAERQTFTVVFSDPNGNADLNVLNLLINTALDGNNACFLAYVRSTGQFLLLADNGVDALFYSGTPSMAANSPCGLYAAGTSVQFSGNSVTLNFDLEFYRPRFGGNRIVYAAARDAVLNNSGWQVMGTIGAQ
ncbi:MAG: hypothetical protein NTV52_01880 [Acidobacteria bacterium]|nr:hypothetical protein [Acidobacteriota bacterium]